MTTQIPAALFADPAPAPSLERAEAALTAHGFTVEILDDAAAARARVQALIPEGTCVFTGASETLRLSGIEADINASGRYQAVRPRVLTMDRATQADEIRQLTASPDGAARAIWIAGAQKVVPDLSTALRRVEEHCLPLESARAQVAYGMPSAINRLLILNAEYITGRGTVLLLREAIGF